MPDTAAVTPPPAAPAREPFPRPWTDADLLAASRLGVFAGRTLAVQGGRLVDVVGLPVPLTRREHQNLWGVVFKQNQRVQLIRGVVVMRLPMTPAHACGIQLARSALAEVFRTGFAVRPQLPLVFAPDTEPHPDVAVVTGSLYDYGEDHPTSAVLIVEVSDAHSWLDDIGDKAELHAAAGIADYWVLDVANRELHVLRDPAPVAAGGHAYRTHTVLGPADTVAPLAAPTAVIPVSDLLP